ncbi:hypothetical protein HYPSUDRAFT_45787 [Hypholoma sublateritium FD-334 SS-4]|uniref:Uncharacterized protein n=1 Tax=Hypholoma sublateritium (strain FD-334 SS-4) TaxID=945553 RepID=A0A0D2NMI2_HYPSF|nr:hypothetical protein HYPSUDRAFT_45787 [Hypholoma sublateritium FD-334 SS-4]
MYNADHDMYQSTRFQDGLTIHRPDHHPRIQEGLQLSDILSQVAYLNTMMAVPTQSPQPDMYPGLSPNEPIPHYPIDAITSLDVQTAWFASEQAICTDWSYYDYGFQIPEVDDSLAIPSDHSWQGPPPPAPEVDYSSYGYESEGGESPRPCVYNGIPQEWQYLSPAPEIGYSSCGYESQGDESSSPSFYNDIVQGYDGKAFQDIVPISYG